MARTTPPEAWATYARALGLEIQRRRVAMGYTQEQAAYAAGLTRSHYQQLEKGLSRPGVAANPSLLTIVAIAQVLGVEPAQLLSADAPDVRAGGFT